MSAVDDKLDRLDTVPDEFYDGLTKFEPKLLRFIEREMSRLVIKNGQVKPTQENLKIVNSILSKVRKFMNSGDYISLVRSFGNEFGEQAKLTEAAFEELVGDFKQSAASKSSVSINEEDAVLLLVGASLDKPLFSKIKSLLTNSVTQSSAIDDAFDGMEVLITGSNERSGALTSYTKTNNNIKDQFTISDRDYTQQSANLLNVEWYWYAGGKIADTRDFCSARDGRYFHKTEVELWLTSQQRGSGNPVPSTKWQGQNPATNSSTIFSLCGGYNCNHTLMPVTIFKVPKGVVMRNIAAGNFSPNANEREFFNIAA